jgi:hypothetical protein
MSMNIKRISSAFVFVPARFEPKPFSTSAGAKEERAL